MLSKFGKEIILVFLLTFLVTFAADFFGDFFVTPENVFSTFTMLLSILFLLLPALAGIAGGFLVAKKTSDLKTALLVPAVGAALAAIVLTGISLVQVMASSDAQIAAEIAGAQEYGISFFDNMAPEELREFLVFSSITGMLFLGIMNLALGGIGGFIGRAVTIRK